MGATAILEHLADLGISVTMHRDALVLRPGSKVPEPLVAELKEHKGAIIERLRHQPRRCLPCLCDDLEGGGASCPACKGRKSRDCGGCLRASMLWREAERYAKYLA